MKRNCEDRSRFWRIWRLAIWRINSGNNFMKFYRPKTWRKWLIWRNCWRVRESIWIKSNRIFRGRIWLRLAVWWWNNFVNSLFRAKKSEIQRTTTGKIKRGSNYRMMGYRPHASTNLTNMFLLKGNSAFLLKIVERIISLGSSFIITK
jgi:hypothetical protein